MKDTEMKSKVAVWALAIVFLSCVLAATKVQADIIDPKMKKWVQEQKYIDDTDLCVASVNYSMKYLQTTDAKELHKAAWSILSNQVTDDAQKLIAITVFHTIQEVSWKMDGMGGTLKTPEDVNNYIRKVKTTTRRECEYAMNRFRFPDAVSPDAEMK